jgi:hypothetical protein
MKIDKQWWRQQGGQFLMATVVTATCIVGAGAISDLRAVAYRVLLALALAAFLPFVIIAGALLVLMSVGVVISLPYALAGAHDTLPGLYGAAELIDKGGRKLVPPYYRFLASRRHPLFWGIAAGIVLGVLILWAFIAVVILPGEARTTRILIEAKDKVDQAYHAGHSFPRSLADCGAPTEDGFGRKLQYRVRGKWMVAKYQITSSGYDGKPSSDDLCVIGSTKAVELAREAVTALDVVNMLRGKDGTASDRLAAISALKCRGQTKDE